MILSGEQGFSINFPLWLSGRFFHSRSLQSGVTLLVQKRCRFKTALTPSMFAGEVGGSNPLAPIFYPLFRFGLFFSRCPSVVPLARKPIQGLYGQGFDSHALPPTYKT